MLLNGLLDPVQVEGATLALSRLELRELRCARPSPDALTRSPTVASATLAEDRAVEHTITGSASIVPTDEMRKSVATRLLAHHEETSELYEHRGGGCRLKAFPGYVSTKCMAFGECASCSLNRLRWPQPRQRFRQLVVSRTEQVLTKSREVVRAVTIGSGCLLTDFEIFLGLWEQGLVIQTIVAIDKAYTDSNTNHEREECFDALNSLAAFFAPCQVFSFGSAEDYIAAVHRRPAVYGMANLFLYCDAAAVPRNIFEDVAVTALMPGAYAFELSNMGSGHCGEQSPLEKFLPLTCKRKACLAVIARFTSSRKPKDG